MLNLLSADELFSRLASSDPDLATRLLDNFRGSDQNAADEALAVCTANGCDTIQELSEVLRDKFPA